MEIKKKRKKKRGTGLNICGKRVSTPRPYAFYRGSKKNLSSKVLGSGSSSTLKKNRRFGLKVLATRKRQLILISSRKRGGGVASLAEYEEVFSGRQL